MYLVKGREPNINQIFQHCCVMFGQVEGDCIIGQVEWAFIVATVYFAGTSIQYGTTNEVKSVES